MPSTVPKPPEGARAEARGIDRGPDVVLIVDDVPDNLAVLHDALDEAGYTVLVATEGDSALQRAAQADPDIVLLDAVMPGMDGFEVARRLKAGPEPPAHIPIIFMTGLTDTEHVVAAFAAGGVDYVTKPIRAPEVLARMAAHMQAARRQRQARNALDAYGHATLVVRWTMARAGVADAAGAAVAAALLRQPAGRHAGGGDRLAGGRLSRPRRAPAEHAAPGGGRRRHQQPWWPRCKAAPPTTTGWSCCAKSATPPPCRPRCWPSA
jgi:DNA-binding response OmpR family regulator